VTALVDVQTAPTAPIGGVRMGLRSPGRASGLSGALADQVAFKLRDRGQQRREKPPLRRGGVPQGITERAERCVGLADTLVERPSRSSLVTRTTSPAFKLAISFASCGRSARAPLIFSR
jgi:hypothetical protein